MSSCCGQFAMSRSSPVANVLTNDVSGLRNGKVNRSTRSAQELGIESSCRAAKDLVIFDSGFLGICCK